MIYTQSTWDGLDVPASLPPIAMEECAEDFGEDPAWEQDMRDDTVAGALRDALNSESERPTSLSYGEEGK